MRTAYTCLVQVLVATLVVGCGGSGGTTPTPSVDLPGLVFQDGFVTNDGVADSVGSGPGVGDFETLFPGRMYRQFFSFNRNVLPAGVTIVSATLYVYQTDVIGNPYDDLGDVVVDYLDYGALDAGDYDLAPIEANIGTISDNPLLEWKTLDVTTQTQDAIGAGRNPQFRFRFNRTIFVTDGLVDGAFFVDAEDSHGGFGNTPFLRITYTN